jgi:amino acid adenylation domain-containing protein
MKKISAVQKTIWLTQNIYTESSIYNVGGFALIEGHLDEDVLVRAIEMILKDADVLVTGYYAFNEPLLQDNPAFSLYNIDTIDFSASVDASQACESWMLADMHLPFNVQENLLKVCLLKAADSRYYWYTKVHHLVFDGYSMALFFNKVSALYTSLLSGNTADIVIGAFPYADFIADGDTYYDSERFKADSQFWFNRFRNQPGEKAFESLVSSVNNPALTSARKEIIISRKLYDQIAVFCSEYQCTAFHYFMTALLILNNRYNNQLPCIGIPVFNRKNKRFKNTLGTFVNMLPFTPTFIAEQTFAAVLTQVKNELKEVYKHQGFPLFDLLQKVDSQGNIYNLSFSYQKNTYEPVLGDAAVTIKYLSSCEQQEDLAFHLLEYGETADLKLGVDYRSHLFTAEAIDTLMRHFNDLLHFLLRDPHRRINEIPFLAAAEKEILLTTFNDTAADFRETETLISLFEEQAVSRPEAIALVFEGRQYSYRTLNEKANQLAHYLRAQHAIVPDDRIGIKLDRSERMIVSLLGALKSGGAYLPVDPAYPQERIGYLLGDSQCKLLIDETAFATFEELASSYSIANPEAVNTATDLAYVIYTSGSTGQPKGCMLEHRGVINRIAWMWEHYGFTTADIILQKTTFTFDVSVWELFMPLCWGARMVLCHKDDVGAPERLLSLIENEEVTCLHFVPSMFNAFISAIGDQPEQIKQLASLRSVMTSGEALPPATVAAWYQLAAIPVHNLYGPTEASIDVTHYTTTPGDTKVPIGRPIWNTFMYVLDAGNQLLPPGVTGEICIGGIGLSRGYLNKPTLTAEKFVANPFRVGERMYKTGDLGRWLADGNIEYLGRKDDQVKIRGYRIELGEIETALLKYPGMETTAIIAKTAADGDKDLVAYIVSKQELSEADLKVYLGNILPAYMIPAYFVPLNELPLTPNGKLDRKKLPDPVGLGLGNAVEYVAPTNPTEEKLVLIWQEILKREKIGIKDNFFDLGGHSLKATRLASQVQCVFDVNLPLKDVFTIATIEAQAAQIAQSLKNTSANITQTSEKQFYPLSAAQRRLWVASQIEDSNIAYNMPGAYWFEGALNSEALAHSFKIIIARHESLRTIFREDENGNICQLILTPAALNFNITEEDLRKRPRRVLQDRLSAAAAMPFNLSEGPLMCAALYQIADNKWIFSFIMHHIISDGWTMNILVKELLHVYQLGISGAAIELPPLRIQYKDYAGWQESQLKSGALDGHKQWWLSQFEGELPVLELPADKIRPVVKTYNGNTIHTVIRKDLTKALKSFARKEEGTLFMGLLAAVNILLYRYTNQSDIIIGSPVAGRNRAELEDQIGLYINTVALRTKFNGKHTYADLFRQVKATAIGAYEHQLYPFDELVGALDLQRDVSRSALFDVMVILQNNESTYLQQHSVGDLVINEFAREGRRLSKFDLLFDFTEKADGITLHLTYNSDIYSHSTISRLSTHLLQLLEAITAHPEQALGELDYLTAAEKEMLLVTFNENTFTLAGDKTLTALLEERIFSTPDHAAIVFEEKIITYRELNEKANQLAHYLQAHFAPQPDERIAIQLERSEWMIIAILGVLKAGAAYVPIDPGYPQHRIDYILSDSQCKTVIDEQQLETFHGEAHLHSTANPASANDAGHLAYIIYTSGSTGRPKGVMIPHRAIVNYLCAINCTYGMDSGDRVVQISNVAFDASVEQIMLSLSTGATLYIVPQATITDPEELGNYIVAHKITHLHTVPVLLEKLNLDGHALKRMVSAGENCPVALAEKYRNTLAFYNKYGPTEATVSSTIYHVTPQAVLNSVIPIGKPIHNSRIYILDDRQGLTAFGVPGEICISGTGLAQGYLNQRELTSEKFIPHPFIAGQVLYRTGDLGRWLSDGNIEYIGRKDDQVKIRGYRIELGEIETALAACPGISGVAVVAKANAQGEKDLVAYLVGQPDLQVSSLKSYLSRILPAYMVPTYYVPLEALPITSNGKLDRRKLPDPFGSGMERAVEYIAASNPTEEKLVLIWQEILGKEKIGIKDNFFDLGGHSLKATRLVSQIHRAFDIKLSLKELFTAATLEDQALLVKQANKNMFIAIAPAAQQDSYPLSAAQRRLWILSQFEEGSIAYNMPGVCRFEGNFKRESLVYAFNQLIARHESLRTIFREDEDGNIHQVILTPETLHFSMREQDLRHAPEVVLNDCIEEVALASFDLTSGPLLRAALYQVADEEWVFIYAMHHIISDGWSMNILRQELLQYYYAHSRGEAIKATPLRIQYKDYASWQQLQLNGEGLQLHMNWWLSQFEGELPVLELPTDNLRPAVKTYNGGIVHTSIGTTATEALRTLVREEGGTLFMGLLAMVNTLLYRYTNQSDIIIGSPVAGREHADLEEQIGFYINTLALRTTFTGDYSYRDLLRQVKATALGAYEHQLYPFDELVGALDLQRDVSRSALFDVMVVLQNNESTVVTTAQPGEMRVNEFAREGRRLSKFDLLFDFTEKADGITLHLTYNSDIYSHSTISRLSTHLLQLLEAITAHPEQALGELDYLTAAEKEMLLVTFNENTFTLAGDKTLTALLEERIFSTPDHAAIVFEEKIITYRELNEKANQLAHYLQAHFAPQPDERIAIQLERSEWMIIAILGVLKAGAAYVPIDPGYPQHRIDYILSDSQCKTVIDEQQLETFHGEAHLHSTANPASANDAGHLAYIIYTSGSTGRPKGVMIPHRAIVNYLCAINCTYGMDSGDRVVQISNVAFDASVEQIMLSLSTGATLYIVPQATITDPEELGNYIVAHKITHLHTVPVLLEKLNLDGHALKRMVSAGENCPVALAEKYRNTLAFYNKYGPTEATVSSTIYHVTPQAVLNSVIPIGKPIHNSRIYILDDRQGLTAFGVPGEICISGTGLAQGYLNQRELTSEKFIPHPFIAGQVLYRTGDLGRWLSDGNIEYIGRKDDQVKIRGYRIELGEIETALAACPGISGVAVVAKANAQGEKDLVAYLVGQPDLQVSSLKSYLSRILPAYMVPTYYVPLEALPITSNGKLDRRKLPDPFGSGMERAVEYIAASNPTEEKLVLIWQEILGKEKIGIKDNFFDLGGHSLKATRLVSQIHRAFDIKLSLKELFTAATLEDQALLVKQANKNMFIAIAPAAQQDSYPLSAAQRRLWILSQFEEGSIAYNMPGVCRFEGNFKRESLVYAFNQLIARHESLRTIFREDEDGNIHQVILTPETLHFSMREQDLRHAPEVVLNDCIEEVALASFDLTSGPLLRAALYQVADEEWVFIYAMHHIISDGWSMNILRQELLQYYYAHSRGEAIKATPLRIQYKDYASWQQLQLNGEGLQLHMNWWLSQFEGELPVLELPTDNLRPAVKTYNGGIVHTSIGTTATEALRTLVREEGGTLFMGLLAMVNTLLYRYTNQSDIIIGSPVAGREHADLEEQIGFYINTLALRTTFTGDYSYRDLLRQVKATALGAYEHQLYPFDELVDVLDLQRDMSRSALFDVMVVLQNNESTVVTTAQPGEMRVNEFAREGRRLSKFDLLFDFTEKADGITLHLTYNSDIYSHSTISRLSTHLLQLVEAITAHPEQALGELDYLTAAEKEQLLTGFNDTASGKPATKTLSVLFEEQVSRTPKHMAVEADGGSFTYAELNEKANQFGHYLRNKYNIHRGELIGVKLERNEWLIVSLLGILKSGGAYVPIDPAYPQDRIDYLLSDSNCRVVVDERELSGFLYEAEHYSTSNLPQINGAFDLAYVIYTSGSTGQPKGVMIEHCNAHTFINWCEEEFANSTFDVVFAVTSICFDLSVFEIFYTLSTGKKIRVLNNALSIAASLHVSENVLLNTVPSVVNTLLNDQIDLSAVTVLNMAGEPIPAKVIAGLDAGKMEVRNLYGPSEDTTYSTIYRIYNDAPVLIGKPIADTQVYILNSHGQLQPTSVAGEICISGSGLSRGYLNKPQLTTEKFVDNPFRAGERLYKTGDLGRWLPNGNIEYLGRKDDQVKIRGHRIELGEIETALVKHADIDTAVVVAKTNADGEKDLVAYIVGKENLLVSDLKVFLGKTLPAYMLPAYYIPLSALPLTANGKLDRKKLPDPTGVASTVEYVAATNETEEKLIHIWQEILGKETIGINDNFFDLGGHSLKATRLASQIHRIFDVKLALKDLFTTSTLQQQATLLLQSKKNVFTLIKQAPAQEAYPLSAAQRRLWVLSQFEEGSVAYNMPGVYWFEGELNTASLTYAFNRLVDRHESLRTVFRENEANEVCQWILTPEMLHFSVVTDNLQHATEETLQACIQKAVEAPFDLATGPLLRAILYQVEDNKWAFAYVMHHIISDGWSLNIFLKELLQYYYADSNGETLNIAPLRIQYKDYAHWQHALLNVEGMQEHRNWWLSQFAGELPVLELPADKMRPAVKTYQGAVVQHSIGVAATEALRSLVREEGGTLFMGLLAAVNMLLYRYTNQSDIIIGSPVAGREHADLEEQIGFYINTLALRTQFSGNNSFLELLQQVKATTMDAYEHQLYPFDELVDALNLKRDMSRSALFDVMLVLQNNDTTYVNEQRKLNNLVVSAFQRTETVSKFDLMFNFSELADVILLKIEYNSDIYGAEMVTRLSHHLEQLLIAATTQPQLPIEQLEYLTTAEEQVLLRELNNTTTPYPHYKTIVDLFNEQAIKTPGHIAICDSGKNITYKELNERSNRLAQYLKIKFAVYPDDLIAIKLERSEAFVVTILGILKSGAAYLPIDPDYPPERISYMEQDSKCLVTIDEDFYENFLLHEKKYAPLPVFAALHPNHLVYVIYTSGSTGNPKGIMMKHSAMVNLVGYHIGLFPEGEVKSVLQFASVSFDVSFQEIFTTLLRGASLYPVAEDKKKDAIELVDFIGRHELDTIFLPTAYFKLLMEDEYFLTHITSTVKHIIVAGEQLVLGTSFINLLKNSDLILHNHYGPAETHVVTTIMLGKNNVGALKKIPSIGKPIHNSRIYILDDRQGLTAFGVPGEICISGTGLAQGYLNQRELTSEKFIPHPFIAGQVLYRTGDLGRWLSDGNIEYIGRKDDQVKIRGYRIELGEIETALAACPGISGVAVVAKANAQGEKDLVAYLVGQPDLQVSSLKSYLSRILPAYMVPTYYVPLEALPITSNGKLDRRKLPDPFGSGMERAVEYIAASNPTEEKLVLIWQEILGKEKIGIKDNFFDLGGHSLKATRLVSQIHRAFDIKLSLKELFTAATLEDQALLVKQANKNMFIAIAPAAQQDSYPLSAAQRRLWILSQFEEGSIAYNMPGVCRFEGNFKRESLVYAFNQLIARHESLRTIFREDEDGNIHQVILTPETLHFSMREQDLRHAPEVVLNDCIEEVALASFDLTSGPLLRAALYQVADEEWVFIYAMHHIISDGWSMNILRQELLQYYYAHSRGEAIKATPLRIQYKDYASWQQLQLNGEGLQLHMNWWLSQFEGELPVLELPTDNLRPAVKTYNGGIVHTSIGTTATEALRTLVREEGGTLFMGLLAMVNTLLYRYTNQSDIIIGSPVAGREHADLEEQIGFYINTLALRTTFTGDYSYRDLLRQVKATALGAYEHQLYPFDELVDVLDLQRDMSRSALFDVMVVLQNNESTVVTTAQPGEMRVNEFAREGRRLSKFDLLFDFTEKADGITLHLTYNSDIYSHSTISRLSTHLLQLVEAITAHPEQALGELDYLTAAEKEMLLVTFNDTAADFRETETLISLFEEQAVSRPEAIALVFEGREYSYRTLNEKANQLAHYLRAQHAIVPDDRIGIKLDRSERMIVSLLGALKSGGAYLPVDPAYPQERIGYLLGDSQCKLLIDETAFATFEELASSYSIANPEAVNTATDLAYVIYTSGSTGQPKGCMLEHRGVINRIAWMWEHYGFTTADIILQKTTFTFDVSVWELFMPLCWGARMVLCHKDDVGAPERLLSLIENEEVTCLHFVPSMFNAFISAIGDQPEQIKQLASLRSVMTSGEALPPATVAAWYQLAAIPVHNLYGPTEASIDVTHYTTTPGDTKVPIGRPIWNTFMYVLDAGNQLLPPGVTGEICIGGIGLSRGYLNKPTLTAEKFVANPFRVGERMYKTGDLGRWLADGNIEYLGRKDDQVKIRGYRIELGEIETALLKYPGMETTAIIAKTAADGDKDLVAYIVSKQELSEADLKVYLGNILPAYMIPAYFVPLNELPLTTNGKLDRKKLPDPVGLGLGNTVEYVAPTNPTEEKLVLIWQEILKREKIGIKDNFFDLGGHSLKATRLASQIHRIFDVKLALKDLFTAATIEAQATLLLQSKKNLFVAIEPVKIQADYPVSSSQHLLWITCQFEESNAAYNIPGIYIFDGPLNRGALDHAFETLIARHESLRTVFMRNEKGEVRQQILLPEHAGFGVTYHDLRAVVQQKETIHELIQEEVSQPFDLKAASLLRAAIYQLEDHKWVFSYTMHHIISDGWSMNILLKELVSFYKWYVKGETHRLSPLRIQYKDYAAWQQKMLQGAPMNRHKNWWLQQFEGELPVLQLPMSNTRPVVKTYRGASVTKIFDKQLYSRILSLAHEQGGTLFIGLLAALNTLLYRYSDQEDIVIGTPVAGREHMDLEDQIGFYVNTLAIRTRFKGEDSFQDLLQQVKWVTMGAYEHQHYPFEQLTAALDLQRHRSRSLLFDVNIILQSDKVSIREAEQELDQLKITPYGSVERTLSKYDLTFSFTEAADGISLSIIYNTDLFDHPTVEGISADLERLLHSIVSQPATALQLLDYQDVTEKHRLLSAWNDTQAIYPEGKTITTLLEEVAASAPNTIALQLENNSLTAEAINELVNRMTPFLVQEAYVKPGQVVAITLHDPKWRIISSLAVLKAGAAWQVTTTAQAGKNCVIVDEEMLILFMQQFHQYPVNNPVTKSDPGQVAFAVQPPADSHLPVLFIPHHSLVSYAAWNVDAYQQGNVQNFLSSLMSAPALTLESLYTQVLAHKIATSTPNAIAALFSAELSNDF